jgi:hypothetical protein
MAGVIGSETLMDATSKAGVWPSSDPAAHTIVALKNGNLLFDTMNNLPVMNIVGYSGPGLQFARCPDGETHRWQAKACPTVADKQLALVG